MRKIVLFLACSLSLALGAQTLNADYQAYIEKYKQTAVNQEIAHKIPACITLAQGLLESGAGKSALAVEANNHFGIKCHSDWTGKTFTQDDDAVGECFRSYKSAEESFEDHSKFLLRPRYQKLFALEISDYKGWARGLKECGYATDPSYAGKLIKIIEDYDLVQIAEATRYSKESVAAESKAEKSASSADKQSAKKKRTSRREAKKKQAQQTVDSAFQQQQQAEIEEQVAQSFKERKINPSQVASVDMYIGHKVMRQGVKRYVIAQPGDTYKGIAAEFKIEFRRICRYNEVGEYATPKAGQKVWINGKAPKK